MSIEILIAAATLEISILGGLWKLQGHLDNRFHGLEVSISQMEVTQASDRAKNEGRWQLLESAIEGNAERIDYRSQQLGERLKNLEKRIDKLEATS